MTRAQLAAPTSRRGLSGAVLLPPACVGLAALSLLLPWDLSFDPWGWVLWGRELTSSHIPFSTSLYPAWKPLAVMFTAPFSLVGDALEPASLSGLEAAIAGMGLMGLRG